MTRMPRQKPHRSKQNYATPWNFIQAACAKLQIGGFAFDFAADSRNTKAPQFWSRGDNSLKKSGEQWAERCRDGWGWLNPPFENIGLWAERCMVAKRHGGRVALLVRGSVGSDWFRDYVDGEALVLFLNGRIPFIVDKPKWLYPQDCILALYAPDIEPGYEVWDWRGEVARRAA